MGNKDTSWSHDEFEEHGDHKDYKHTSGISGNGHAPYRDRASENMTGALPALGSSFPQDYVHTESPEFEYLLQSLHELFERDRQMASQPDTTRCGLCYLYFPLNELYYRDEGFYICPACQASLGNQRLPMLHKQQKL